MKPQREEDEQAHPQPSRGYFIGQHHTLHSFSSANNMCAWKKNPRAKVSQAHRPDRAQGEMLKLEHKQLYICMQAWNFVQKQSKSKLKQELTECEGRVWGKALQNLSVKSVNRALKLKDHALD